MGDQAAGGQEGSYTFKQEEEVDISLSILFFPETLDYTAVQPRCRLVPKSLTSSVRIYVNCKWQQG